MSDLEQDLNEANEASVNKYTETFFSIVNKVGTLGPRTFMHDVRVALNAQHASSIYRFKCMLRAMVTGAATVFGVVWPIWLSPELGLNMQAVFLQIMGFLPAGAYVAGVLTIALAISATGAWLSDQVIDASFKQYLKTSHVKLYFSDADIKKMLSMESIQSYFQNNEVLLRNAIEFLQAEYNIKNDKQKNYKPHAKILTIADKLRTGNAEPLMKYLSKKLEGYRVALDGHHGKVKLSTQEQINQFLQQESAKPEVQMKLLLCLVKQYQSAQSQGGGKKAIEARMQKALDLAAAINRKDDEGVILPNDISLTPGLDEVKRRKYQQQQKKLQPLLDAMTGNTQKAKAI